MFHGTEENNGGMRKTSDFVKFSMQRTGESIKSIMIGKGNTISDLLGFGSVTVLGHEMDCLRNEKPYLRVLRHQLENSI